MPSPSASLATQRPDLAGSFMEFDLAMNRAGFISTRVFPVLEVASQAGTFGRIPIAQLLQNRDTLRAPGAGYSRQTWKFTTDSYATQEHGAEEAVDDRESRMYADYFDAELISAERARSAVMRNGEKRVIDVISTNWTGDTAAAANGWETATGTPIGDVETAVRAVYDNSGLRANAMVISWKKFRDLRNNAEIIDRIKFAGFTDPRAGAINLAAMAQVFDLDEIIVAGSQENTANQGQAASLSPLWTDTEAFVCRVATTQDIREPCIGRVFHWSEDGSTVGGTVETYREEGVRGDIARVRHDVDEKLLYQEAGSQITAV